MKRQSGRATKRAPRNCCHCSTRVSPTNQTTTAVRTIWAATQALFRRAGDGGAIGVGVASGNRLWSEGGKRVQPSRGTERGAVVLTRQQGHERRRQCPGVNGAHENAGAVVLHDVGQSTRVERDDRRLAQLRLDGDETESFFDRRNDERSRSSIELGEPGLWESTMPTNAIGNAKPTREL